MLKQWDQYSGIQDTRGSIPRVFPTSLTWADLNKKFLLEFKTVAKIYTGFWKGALLNQTIHSSVEHIVPKCGFTLTHILDVWGC